MVKRVTRVKKRGGKVAPRGPGGGASVQTGVNSPTPVTARPKARVKKPGGKVLVDITAAASVGHRWCALECQGQHVQGMWIHDAGCPEIRMIWKKHGATKSDWACAFGCPGQEMPSGFTHHWDCQFWVAQELAPF